MRKPVEGLVDQRRTEILDACEKLYKEKGFREITIKDISTVTSFSRPSIYNYFKTKEEIFLGLLTREYEIWVEDLKNIRDVEAGKMTTDDLADQIARTLSKRTFLLKVTAMNLYEIEDNSSLERLTEYKIAFKKAMEEMTKLVETYHPNPTSELLSLIQRGFFPFMYGIYPYTSPTKNQIKAMDAVGIPHKEIGIYEISYQFLKKLFS